MRTSTLTPLPLKDTGACHFKRTGLNSCRKIRDQINRARQSIFGEALPALPSQERLLHLAVNEAESLAWETGYPHLFFPSLAMEKVNEVIAWKKRQESVWRASPVSVLAA